MKRILTMVLVFAVLLVLGALADRYLPKAETIQEEAASAPAAVTNSMTPDSATLIRFGEDEISCLGVGTMVSDGCVTIGYPGTYRVSGSRMNGQIVVDMGDYHGGVYIILDGVSLSCMDGPAIYVKQADRTVIYLEEGTQNTLRDGAAYTILEKTKEQSGAGIYSADDLVIEGEGALMVAGSSADGIRSKDGLVISGGAISVYAADDGLQASDYAEISGGSVMISAYGDGISTTEGYVTVSGGDLDIRCGGDGVQAVTALTVTDGSVKVISHGGADQYSTVELEDISARGLKAEDITITGGTVELDTADDGIHAARDLVITGGSFRLSAGDDAVSAGGTLDIADVTLDVLRSYEALQGETVSLRDVTITAAAENNGVDGGEGGVSAENTAFVIAAPRAVSTDGTFSMRGGSMLLNADGTDSLFAFHEADIVGADILAYADAGRADVLLEKGMIDGSLLYIWNSPLPAGTRFKFTDPAGTPVMTLFRHNADTGALLVISGALMEGQAYALEAGDAEPVVLTFGEGCAIYEAPIPQQRGAGGQRR